MKKFFALLKVSLRSMLVVSSGVGRKKKKKAVSGVGAVVLISVLALYISGVYSTLFVSVLAPLGMESLVFVFMGIAALVTGLMFTAVGASSAVYGGKDNDLLLALPVSSTTLMAARVSAIYLENLLLSFFMLLPAGAACAAFGVAAAATVGFWVRLTLAALLLPLLDTALSVLVGALLAWISARMKHRAIAQNFIMALYLVAVFWFAFNLTSMMDSLALNAANVRASLGWAAPAVWMGDAVLGDWAALGKFALSCLLPCAVVVYGLGKCYRKVVSAFAAKSARSDYRLTAQRSSGCFRALLAKETRRYFGTPIYLWNTGLGPVLLVAAGVAAIVKRADIEILLAEILGQTGAIPQLHWLIVAAGWALTGFCLSLCAISAPSFSLEGKQLWILRTAPIGERALLRVKTWFEVIIALPGTLVGCACFALAFALSPLETAALLAFPAVFLIGHAHFGTLVGLAFIRTDLDDSAIIKRSLLSFLSTFGPLAALVGIGVGVWQLWLHLGAAAAMGIGFAAVAALSVACIAAVHAKGPAMLQRIA